jgi:hypothetical protein
VHKSQEHKSQGKNAVSAGGRDEHHTEARRHACGEVRKKSANRRQKPHGNKREKTQIYIIADLTNSRYWIPEQVGNDTVRMTVLPIPFAGRLEWWYEKHIKEKRN